MVYKSTFVTLAFQREKTIFLLLGDQAAPPSPSVAVDVNCLIRAPEGLMRKRSSSRCLDVIVRRAGLDNPGLPRITPHQLRYTFGSLLIDVGEATSRVSRLMGHANEAITGSVYAHEIDRRDNAERTRASLRAAFGSARETRAD